ncbi:hypothetical protein JDV02_000181 [Purpureocillium takamizusanense]|uniref:Uncharacterized protein n=1 Tax=Purpureocillium takamizusanense TaxID=2060973 RepID=A0A9Q8Q494_9HYPO|nr:uncharacterized protein JDV02_000181 [Purpureocillium takamizusanense]UNI13433.1 hypothetical protein JDV02_000181 [Purpureocillium takamizusanense]
MRRAVTTTSLFAPSSSSRNCHSPGGINDCFASSVNTIQRSLFGWTFDILLLFASIRSRRSTTARGYASSAAWGQQLPACCNPDRLALNPALSPPVKLSRAVSRRHRYVPASVMAERRRRSI